MSGDIRDAVRKAEQKLTGKRFCQHCQCMKPIEGGKMVGDKLKRFQCALCINRSAIGNKNRLESEREN